MAGPLRRFLGADDPALTMTAFVPYNEKGASFKRNGEINSVDSNRAMSGGPFILKCPTLLRGGSPLAAGRWRAAVERFAHALDRQYAIATFLGQPGGPAGKRPHSHDRDRLETPYARSSVAEKLKESGSDVLKGLEKLGDKQKMQDDARVQLFLGWNLAGAVTATMGASLRLYEELPNDVPSYADPAERFKELIVQTRQIFEDRNDWDGYIYWARQHRGATWEAYYATKNREKENPALTSYLDQAFTETHQYRYDGMSTPRKPQGSSPWPGEQNPSSENSPNTKFRK